MRLVCNGYYPEIHVVHPRRLEILFSLCAQVQPDWISALCILRPIKREGADVIFVRFVREILIVKDEFGPSFRAAFYA